MADVSGIQNVFSAGELSPFLDARSDLTKYNNGGLTVFNFLAFVQGILQRRPGFHFAARVKDSSKQTRVMKFEFSITQAYIIEVGDQYMRFFRNNGSILEADQTITDVTSANPGVIEIVGHGYSNGDELFITSVGGTTELNGKRYLVANATSDTFTLTDLDGVAIDTTSMTAYTSGGTAAKVFELTTTYLEADLFQLKTTQSADVLYLTHPSYPPRKLERTGHTAWTISDIEFQDGPYLPENSTTTTLNPVAATGTTTVVASSTTGINNDQGFLSTDIGRSIRIRSQPSDDWGWGVITAVASTTSITVEIKSTLTTAPATAVWRLGLWSDTTGYPSCSTFYEDRLWFGGSTDYPQRLDGSNSGDYENFKPTDADGLVPDDRAVSFTLNADDVNVIRWLKDDEKGLLAGTVGGEWIVRASTSNEVITPSNIKAVRSSSHGSADIAAIRAGQAVTFVQRSARKLRELAYVFEQDGFRAPDLTLLSEHITKGGMVELDYQQEPQSWIWAPRTDGTLLCVNYVREQDAIGWTRHSIGGTNAKVESVASIPTSDETTQELWAVTSRTINGGTKRFIEYMHKVWEDGDSINDAFFLDAGLTYNGSPVSTISGLDHLEGETVSILADGATHPTEVVTNGSVTLDRQASVIHVGLNYFSDFGSMKPDLGSRSGTGQGKLKRINEAKLRVWQSVNAMVGSDASSLTRIIFRDGNDLMDSSVPLFTGDKKLALNSTYGLGEVYVRADQPLPLNIIALMIELAPTE